MRIYIRRSAGLGRTEDWAFYAAIVVALGELGTTLFCVSCGLGKNVDLLGGEARGKIDKGVFAASLLYVATLALSKVACGLVFVRLTPFEGVKRVAWGLVAAASVWMGAGLLAEGFACRELLGRCPGYTTRWVYISVFDMVLEASLFGASVYMVWSRAMSSRAKYTVVGAFSCRLP